MSGRPNPTKQQKLSPLLALLFSFVIAVLLCLGTLGYAYFLNATDPNLQMRVKPALFMQIVSHRGWKILLLMVAVYVAGSALLSLLVSILWNRRASRLNRKATLPQPAPASDTGIWPPPPTVSISADTLPKK